MATSIPPGSEPITSLTAAAESESTTKVTVRTDRGAEFSFVAPNLKQEAMRWSYVVSNRKRWVPSPTASGTLGTQSWELFQQFGLGSDQLQAAIEANLVEVSIPYREEAEGWEARIFPWEYVISAAVRSQRGHRPLTVVRHLKRSDPSPPSARKLARLLLLRADPRQRPGAGDLEPESPVFARQLGLENDGVTILVNPTRAALRAAIVELAPEVIHISGLNTWDAAPLLDLPENPNRMDGLVLLRDEGGFDEVNSLDLAGILNAAGSKPLLVGCSLWSSAARVSALIVAEGASASIGFQDVIDDELVKLFFWEFYRAFRLSEGRALLAFLQAQAVLQARPEELTGSGIVLWRGRSINDGLEPATIPDVVTSMPPRKGTRATTTQSRRAGKPAGPALSTTAPHAVVPKVATTARELREIRRCERAREITRKDGRARELIQVEIKEYQQINYSLLHNNRGLFERFTLHKTIDGVIRDIELEVDLFAGAESSPYRGRLDLIDIVSARLEDRIRVPLTSSLGRGLREGVRTSLLVKCSWNGEVFYQETHGVKLLAIDEWRDDDRDRIWLPSFVLPRDPAVARVIDTAQKYLMALLDDSTAGFDGYQGVDRSASDPAVASAAVNLQVKAIWSSLVFDGQLAYVNPPPTYTRESQRLRTPSDTLEGNRGTCIDLALLLSACLEYVDIYPVIFLLEGHAFPGYWRDDELQRRFVAMDSVTPSNTESFAPTGSARWVAASKQEEGWFLDKDHYAEVMELIHSGAIVPIETVWLTRRGSFWDAIDEGVKNLRSKDDFQAMIDVKRARNGDVTPLPIQWEGGR